MVVHLDRPVEPEAMEEIARGMMLASLAITDNKEKTLEKVGKANPWHIEALKLITGSEERAHRPLKDILYDDMDGLTMDTAIDVSGVTKGAQFLDTQGYIAHNDDIVVVAFRCTTSIFDWMTNFNSSSSAWEVEEDLTQGYSGFCSGYEGLCCTGGEYKPRVHTGFYNNFLASLPTIKEHVDQYLLSYERPRTLYIVGHSLGAGIANLTATYFLMNYDWNALPQSLVLVTAGSPRSICKSMKAVTDEKLQHFGPQKVRFYRIVKGSDAVTTVPPKILGFEHMTDATMITDEGPIVLRSRNVGGDEDTNFKQFNQLKDQQEHATRAVFFGNADDDADDDDDDDADGRDESNDEEQEDSRDGAMVPKSKYDRMVARIPKALRDHMPDFYLRPIFKARGIKSGSSTGTADIEGSSEEEAEMEPEEATKKDVNKQLSRRKKRTWLPRVFRKKETQQQGPTYF